MNKESLCFCLLELINTLQSQELCDDFYFILFLCNILLLLHDRIKIVNSCFCTY
jgi:hypothetical protein